MTKKICLVSFLAGMVVGNLACKKNNPVDSTSWDLTGKIIFRIGSISILDLNAPSLSITTLVQGDEPRVSPDHATVVYDAISPEGSGDIYTIGLSGGQPTDLTNDKVGSDSWPDWSPDGSSIVFNRVYYSNNKEALCTMNSDGTHLRVLTDTASVAIAAMPRWSPDASAIAYVTASTLSKLGLQQYSLYTIRPDGSQPTPMDNNVGLILPRWSPDSRSIAYAKSAQSASDTTYGLYVVDIATKTQKKIALTGARVVTAGFCWLSTSQLICVGTNRSDSTCGVYLVSTEASSTQKSIATGFLELPSSTPSPDGRRLVIFGQRTGDTSLTVYIVNADGTDSRRLKETGVSGWVQQWYYNQWII